MKWKPRIVSLISCVLGNDNDNGIEIRPKKYEMLNCLRLRLNRIINSKDVPREAEVAQGVPGRLKPRIFLTFWHYKGGRSSAKRTGRFYHRRNPWYSLSEAAQYENSSELKVALRVITFFGFRSGCLNVESQCRCRPGIVVRPCVKWNTTVFWLWI